MYKEEFAAMSNAAANKVGMLKKNPLGYFLLSVLAGAYIGFGILLIFTEGGLLGGKPGDQDHHGSVLRRRLKSGGHCGG